jgi:hypothetical protein
MVANVRVENVNRSKNSGMGVISQGKLVTIEPDVRSVSTVGEITRASDVWLLT